MLTQYDTEPKAVVCVRDTVAAEENSTQAAPARHRPRLREFPVLPKVCGGRLAVALGRYPRTSARRVDRRLHAPRAMFQALRPSHRRIKLRMRNIWSFLDGLAAAQTDLPSALPN